MNNETNTIPSTFSGRGMLTDPTCNLTLQDPADDVSSALLPSDEAHERHVEDDLHDLDDIASNMSKIMIVDDDSCTVELIEKYLYDMGYRYLIPNSDPRRAFSIVRRECPDLVLLDLQMPHVSGLDILRELRADRDLRQTPVIIVSASTDPELKQAVLRLRVTDFLNKPLDKHDLMLRVRNALIVKSHQDHLVNYARELEEQVRQRTAELAASRREVILCLARAAEFRDNETGNHVVRVGRYVGIIARELGFCDEKVQLLEQAAQLHDVGKIGIPDAILLKPGKLEPAEFETMQRHAGFGRKIIRRMPSPELEILKEHTALGAKLLEVVRSPIIELAATIALTHHEKWDGSGYPLGLSGEDIPMEGRMTAVADVYDALSTKRPYKQAFPRKKCFQMMEELRGKQFDPRILDAFFRRRRDVAKVQMEWADLD